MTHNAKMIGGAALLLLALVYFYGRTGGKRKGERNSTTIAPVPNPEHIDPNLDVVGLAQRIHYQLNGLSWWYSDARKAVLNELLNLNNSEFIAVYNQFNTAHGDGDTLRSWIESESGLGDSLETRLMERFRLLNLS